MRNKLPFPPCPPRFIFCFPLCQTSTCSLPTSPGGVWLAQEAGTVTARQSRAGWVSPGLSSAGETLPLRQGSSMGTVRQGAARGCLPPTGMVGLLLIRNAPPPTCAPSHRPTPGLRKSCKVSAVMAVPVEADRPWVSCPEPAVFSFSTEKVSGVSVNAGQVSRLFFFFFFLFSACGDLRSIRRMQVGCFTRGRPCPELCVRGEGE